MRKVFFTLAIVLFLSSALYAQKDTLSVQGLYESGGTYGTLNDAIDNAISGGTINNTVFKLTPYEVYVLSRSIYIDHGQSLDIYAPKPGTTQESAPPQIVWTEEGIDRGYVIQSYGDVKMTNIWVRFADILGNQVSGSIVFENQDEANDPEQGDFEGCIFEYCGIGVEAGGTITVKGDHFVGNFQDCYFRNLSDIHFRYYGRAVSFPYESTGWHYDSLLFENCTFVNIARIVMQEGNEWSDKVQINHCTVLNTLEWVFQSAGWIKDASLTNSLFVNPNVLGYRALDVCDETQDFDDFEDGLCNSPGGGLINGITPADSFAFEVDWTDYDRKVFIGNNVWTFEPWMQAWYTECTWCKEQIRQRHPEELYNPPPMLGQGEIDFIDSTDADGNKAFPNMNVDWATIYEDDPEFIVPATNEDTMKIFVEYKWNNNADIDWAYDPGAGQNQTWPLPENMAFANAMYQTAAMGGLPLGDLNWFPEKKAEWEAQRETEWSVINNWLEYGNPNVSVKETDNIIPSELSLSQNYPNPFNPTTTIEFSLPLSGHVSLKVFNTMGQEVITLMDGDQKAGSYKATFDGTGLSSGTYLYRLQAGNDVLTRKFVLMK